MHFEECCWWNRGHQRGQMAEERCLFKSRPWSLRAVLPTLPLLSWSSESLVQTSLPPRLAAAASCPAWKLSTATGLINCGCFWMSVWPAPNCILTPGLPWKRGSLCLQGLHGAQGARVGSPGCLGQ